MACLVLAPGQSDGNTPRPAGVPLLLWLRPGGSTDWRNPSHRAQAQSPLLVTCARSGLLSFIHDIFEDVDSSGQVRRKRQAA